MLTVDSGSHVEGPKPDTIAVDASRKTHRSDGGLYTGIEITGVHQTSPSLVTSYGQDMALESFEAGDNEDSRAVHERLHDREDCFSKAETLNDVENWINNEALEEEIRRLKANAIKTVHEWDRERDGLLEALRRFAD